MALAHPKAVEQMKGIAGQLAYMKTGRALEVACGGCEVTRDFLREVFEEVDLMDQCAESIALARQLKEEYKIAGAVFQSSMEAFEPEREYSLVVMRYCTGYLDGAALAEFLRKMAKRLLPNQN